MSGSSRGRLKVRIEGDNFYELIGKPASWEDFIRSCIDAFPDRLTSTSRFDAILLPDIVLKARTIALGLLDYKDEEIEIRNIHIDSIVEPVQASPLLQAPTVRRNADAQVLSRESTNSKPASLNTAAKIESGNDETCLVTFMVAPQIDAEVGKPQSDFSDVATLGDSPHYPLLSANNPTSTHARGVGGTSGPHASLMTRSGNLRQSPFERIHTTRSRANLEVDLSMEPPRNRLLRRGVPTLPLPSPKGGGGPIRTHQNRVSHRRARSITASKSGKSRFVSILRGFLRGIPAFNYSIQDVTVFRVCQVQELIRCLESLPMNFEKLEIGGEPLGQVIGIAGLWESTNRYNACMELTKKLNVAGDLRYKIEMFRFIQSLIDQTVANSSNLVSRLGKAGAFVELTKNRNCFWRRMRGACSDGVHRSVMTCRVGELEAAWAAENISGDDEDQNISKREPTAAASSPSEPGTELAFTDVSSARRLRKPMEHRAKTFSAQLAAFLRPQFPSPQHKNRNDSRAQKIQQVIEVHDCLRMDFAGTALGQEHLGVLVGLKDLFASDARRRAMVAENKFSRKSSLNLKIRNIREVRLRVSRVTSEFPELVAKIGEARAFVQLTADQTIFWEKMMSSSNIGNKNSRSFLSITSAEMDAALQFTSVPVGARKEDFVMESDRMNLDAHPPKGVSGGDSEVRRNKPINQLEAEEGSTGMDSFPRHSVSEAPNVIVKTER
ncbi:hypothetical protein HDU93_004876 [Gonapodya sp. JEL0774]|nr:hypothetical protein HDU93_004876 [Gonapodya sp. JEL0774]